MGFGIRVKIKVRVRVRVRVERVAVIYRNHRIDDDYESSETRKVNTYPGRVSTTRPNSRVE